jgi:hypothetical protein
MAARWNPSYFTIGLPIFARRGGATERTRRSLHSTSFARLEDDGSGGVRVSASRFANGGEEGLQYVPLMRGVIWHKVGSRAWSYKAS